jgi:hypothetical protein
MLQQVEPLFVKPREEFPPAAAFPVDGNGGS